LFDFNYKTLNIAHKFVSMSASKNVISQNYIRIFTTYFKVGRLTVLTQAFTTELASLLPNKSKQIRASRFSTNKMHEYRP